MVTKENKIKIIKYIWYIVGTVSLLMAPVVSYFMFEYVTGNLDTVPYYMAVLNIGWIFRSRYPATTRGSVSLSVLIFGSSISVPVSCFCAQAQRDSIRTSIRKNPIMLFDILFITAPFKHHCSIPLRKRGSLRPK